MVTNEELSFNSISITQRLIGNKWRVMIIGNLLDGALSFTEIRKRIPNISKKVLTENLCALEKDKLVISITYPMSSLHNEYELSKLGISMKSLLLEMEKWGLYYLKWLESNKIQGRKKDVNESN